MNRSFPFFIVCFLGLFCVVLAQGQSIADRITLRGYIKEMPGLRLDKDFGDARFDNLIHNRLNIRAGLADHIHLHLEGRNRLMYNSLFKDFPVFGDLLARDDGWMDLSWVWLNQDGWIGHTAIDRMFLDIRYNQWQFRAGRQRINWGITMVSNPNDLFNTYSFFDIDYPERPGADALRVQYNTGFASRIEAAWSPAREARQSVGALLVAWNLKGYDFQALAGYYHHRAALGGGWAGNIGGAGFKGEATWFYHLEEQPGADRGDLVVATGVDYMFGSGTFAVLEVLYNGGYQPIDPLALFLNQPLRADNIMFSEYAITLNLQHPFSPVFSGGLALMSLPDQQAFFLLPSLSRSLLTNLDMEGVAQIFVGGKESIFRQAGSAWYLSLKYAF